MVEDNNLVKEMYPEQVKSINPYDISYIAMKNGSIIMIIEKIPSKNNTRSYYYQTQGQNSPSFNKGGKKYISYINQEKKTLEENNNLNYSFRNNDKNNNNFINKESNEDKNPCLIEKRKYIFYKKSNNKEKEKNEEIDKSPLKHSKTFSYSNATPIKKKNNLENINRSTLRNNGYNNISIIHSKYSSKKNKNKTYNSNFTYGYIKSKSENINLNEKNIIYSDENYDIYKKPKIEHCEDYTINRYSIEQFDNHNVLSNAIIKNNRPKTPILTMRDLGKKNYRKNKGNNLELKKCLSKENHRYYERKELSAPKKYNSNYIKKKSSDGNTIHVFEDK